MLLRRYHKKPKKKKAKVAKKQVDYTELKVADLKEIAKSKGIEGYSNMNGKELLKALAGD